MNVEKVLLKHQRSEITEYHIYSKLAKIIKDKKNKKILKSIGQDELNHYHFWQRKTKQDVKPNMLKVYWYVFLARTFGLTFALRLMEKGEENAQYSYENLVEKYPDVKKVIKEEEEHEKKLIGLLEDQRLNYAGAIVLGLNDALVELTGTLAGLTLAFQNSTIIGATGLIMGIAASMSMAASGYLSSKEEENDEKNPIKSAIYTGVAYLITVFFLVMPYFLISNVYAALGTMLAITLLIIFGYNFYISVAKQQSLASRFFQMAAISLGVALISFILGSLIKTFFGIEI